MALKVKAPLAKPIERGPLVWHPWEAVVGLEPLRTFELSPLGRNHTLDKKWSHQPLVPWETLMTIDEN